MLDPAGVLHLGGIEHLDPSPKQPGTPQGDLGWGREGKGVATGRQAGRGLKGVEGGRWGSVHGGRGWMEVCNTVQEVVIKTIPKKKKCKKAKWLSGKSYK